MPEKDLGPGPEQPTPAGNETPAADPTPDPTPDTPKTPDADPAPPPAGGQQYTQEELDSRIAAARRKSEAEAKAALERLAELEKEAEERRLAELSEAEKAKELAEKAKAEAEAAKNELAAAKRDALRAELLMREAPELPVAYKQLVHGEDEETIAASIAEAKAQYDADRGKAAEATLAELATLTPEQLLEKYPEAEAAKAIAARLTGAPQAIGGASNTGAQPPARQTPSGPLGMTPQEFVADVAAKGTRLTIPLGPPKKG